MDRRPKCLKKFAFSSVCVYNRLRVDGALVCSSGSRQVTCRELEEHVDRVVSTAYCQSSSGAGVDWVRYSIM